MEATVADNPFAAFNVGIIMLSTIPDLSFKAVSQ
jgi:hypothetical protein